MSADDPEKGYPLMLMGGLFCSSQNTNSKVSITAKNREGHMDWQIPYKAGSLKVHLTDARTGEQITAMFYKLVARSRSNVFTRGSSSTNTVLLVPPNEDIYFTVTAPGYREWPEEGTKGRLLNLLPGAAEDLSIALQPAGS